MKDEKRVARRLTKQAQVLAITELLLLKSVIDDVLNARASEVALIDELLSAAKKGNAHSALLGVREMSIVVDGELTGPIVKGGKLVEPAGRHFLVTDDGLHLLRGQKKIDGLRRAGAQVLNFNELPAELKVKALELLV